MIAPGMTLKRALLFSLCLHAALFIATGPRFQRKTIRYWISTPVELVSMPAAKTTDVKPAEQVQPVPEKKKTPETKKIKEKKAEPKKEIVIAKPKEKAAEPKPEAKPVPPAVPEPVPAAAPPQTQSMTVIPDIADFPYAYYLKIIKKNVGDNWDIAHSGAGSHTVTVYFKIDRDGKVQDASVEKTSGKSYYDQVALKAVLRSNPFPGLPDGYKESFLIIHYNFKYDQEE
jgi:TonB family protein